MTNLTTRQQLGHHDRELYLDDRHLIGRVGSIDGTNVLNVGNTFLTANDLRAIADLLDTDHNQPPVRFEVVGP